MADKHAILITGATGSMGIIAVKAMAREGYPVIMACRNTHKGAEVLSEVRTELPSAEIELRQLDLSSKASVRSFVAGMLGTTLAGIFNNAGTMERVYSLTEDGMERTMEVNYVNSAVMTLQLLPCLEEGGRIVNMVSMTTKFAKFRLDWQSLGEKDFRQLGTYGMSKLAFLYFSIALARRYPQYRINVADPGVVNSKMITMHRWYDPLADIFFRPFISSPEKGVQSSLAALHADGSLRYYVGNRHNPIPARFQGSDCVDKVWEQIGSYLA